MHQQKAAGAGKRQKTSAPRADETDLVFTGERIVPQADNCEPNFASRIYHEHIARYLFASQLTPGKSVIDIGCGVGYGSQRLAELGAGSVFAFDLSENAIKHAKIHYAHPNVHYDTGDAENFAFDHEFDVAVCFELIEHVRHPKKVLDNIKRALKPDGILVMSTPRALEQKRTDFHEHEFQLDEYVSMLRDYFSTVDIYVENNHFSSLVTKAYPTELRRIECLKDQFDPSIADVFIAVATSSSTPLPMLEPVLAIDSDAYVTMLERDVDILHKAETDLQKGIEARDEDIRRLEREYKGLFDRSEELSAKLWQAEQHHSQVGAKDVEIKRLTAEYENLFNRSEELSTKLWEAEQQNAEVGAKNIEIERLTAEYKILFNRSEELSSKLWEAEMKTAELENEREKMLGEMDWLTVRCADADSRRLEAYEFARTASQEAHGLRRELEILRRDIAEALDNPSQSDDAQYDERHKDIVNAMERLFLGTDATHHMGRDALADRVSRVTHRANRLEAEIQALREFQRHAEDWHNQLLRIRKSFSWRMTAPLRRMTRPFRRS